MKRLLRQCIAVVLFSMLFHVLSSHAASSQPENLYFSGWSFGLPPQLGKTEQTGERLVLKLRHASAGQYAIITLYAPQAVHGEPDEWLDGKWRALGAGRRIVYDAPQNEAALMDGSSGLRRSANTGNGEGLLQADAYIVGDRAYVMVVEAEGEKGMSAYLDFLMGLALAPAGQASLSAPPPAAAQAESPLPAQAIGSPPLPLGPDLLDTIDLKGPAEAVRTSADLDELSVKDALGSFLKENQYLLGGVRPRPLAFPAAMAKVRALVGVEKNAGYLGMLRAHPPLQSPDALIQNAATRLVKGAAPEALASLLVAHERWPGDSLVMFNIASVLSQYGHVNESQAILGEIRRLGIPPQVAPGFSSQSAMEYLRGYNEARLGQYDDAARTLRGVAGRDPYLAEAALMLALVEDRLGGNPRLRFLKGYFRRSAKFMKPGLAGQKKGPSLDESRVERGEHEDVPVEQMGEADEMDEDVAALPAIYFVDLSKGQPGSLRKVERPSTLEDAITFFHWYAEMTPVFQARIASLEENRERLSGRWGRNIAPGPRLDRYEAILSIFSEANARLPELYDLVRDREEAMAELSDADGRLAARFMEELARIARRYAKEHPLKACPDIKALVAETHAAQMAYVKKAEVAARRAHHLWRLYATALGGMASDPDFRAYIKADVELADAVAYYGLVANMFEAVKYSPAAEDCIALERRAREEAEKQDEAELAPCDDKNKETKGVRLGPFVLEKSCDGSSLSVVNDLLEGLEMKAEAKFDREGWLQEHRVSATVGTDGAKVSGEVATDKEGGFKEVKAGVEGGFGPGRFKGEVSRDSKGNTTFYGGRKTGGELGFGPAKVGASSEEGSGYTVDSSGRVTSTFTRTVTESSASAGAAGVSSRNESVTVVPGPGVGRGAPVLSEYQ